MATYKESGVDIDAGNESVIRIKDVVRETFTDAVVTGLGSFGAMFSLKEFKDLEDPILVQSIDSVGTKLMIATMMNKHDTIGIDMVSHSANDVLCQGARPLTFLDYIAANKIKPDHVEQIVRGVAEGCKQAGMSVIGGEIAELPGVYAEGEYDLVGAVAGVVDRSRVVTGDKIVPGDKVIGLASVGLHTNGFSLARYVLFSLKGYNVTDYMEELGETLGEALLKPHRCYAPPVLQLLDEFEIKGIAHITGGGLIENPIRVLPDNCGMKIYKDKFTAPPIFKLIVNKGEVSQHEAYRTLNMGVGMILVVAADKVDAVLKRLSELVDYPVWEIGEVVEGEKKVQIS
ncbi:MAG: phosphoribosylformylglycinamidine cyclo-ligase [Candidatus Gracilibacteria bacterium]|nr:phosphoribosylformylglycinamidine cyclo-ligase [Candidatus Gracilibacteria bacterium]